MTRSHDTASGAPWICSRAYRVYPRRHMPDARTQHGFYMDLISTGPETCACKESDTAAQHGQLSGCTLARVVHHLKRWRSQGGHRAVVGPDAQHQGPSHHHLPQRAPPPPLLCRAPSTRRKITEIAEISDLFCSGFDSRFGLRARCTWLGGTCGWRPRRNSILLHRVGGRE